MAALKAHTIAELCGLYFADAAAGRLMTRRRSPKKGTTLATDFGRIERHIKPLLGRRTVGAVTREDVEAFMHDVAAGKTASRTKTKPRGLARVAPPDDLVDQIVRDPSDSASTESPTVRR